jgi:hypothetical protein
MIDPSDARLFYRVRTGGRGRWIHWIDAGNGNIQAYDGIAYDGPGWRQGDTKNLGTSVQVGLMMVSSDGRQAYDAENTKTAAGIVRRRTMWDLQMVRRVARGVDAHFYAV